MKGRFAYIPEIILLFLALDGLNLLFLPKDLGFLTIPFSPYWIPILVVASRYGLTGGLTAGAVAALHLLYFAFGHLPSKVELQIQTEQRTLDLPFLFLLVSAFLGGVRQRFIRKERQLEADLEKEIQQVELEAAKYHASEEVRQAIEAKVVGHTVTIRTLYQVAMQFSEMEEAAIFQGCLQLLADHFQVHRASIWLRQGEYYLLQKAIGWPAKERVEGKRRADETVLDFALRRNSMTTLRQIQEWEGKVSADQGPILALFPIQDLRGVAIGVLAIEEMEFLSLTRSNLDLIDLIVEWMSRALMTQRRLNELESDVMWDPKFNIYSPHYFHEALNREFTRSRNLDQELTVAMLQVENYAGLNPETRDLVAQSVVVALKRRLDSSSLLCSYDLEGVFAVVSPSMEKEVLNDRLKEVQGELHEMAAIRTLKLEEKIARYNPYLTFGSVACSPEMESGADLERAALKACGLGAIPLFIDRN